MRIDFETFSTAGYQWDAIAAKWSKLEGASKYGLQAVGAEAYASHPSTRVICLAWGSNIWRPGMATPAELFERVRRGELCHAYNSLFEYWIWNRCLPDWPELLLLQLRDTAPAARSAGLPGALGNAAAVLGLDAQKDKRGKQLIGIFSVPRNPTKANPKLVTLAADLPAEASEFEEYCLQDVEVEGAVSDAIPPLSDQELEVWKLDQEINTNGFPIDMVAVEHALEILRQAPRVLNAELRELTGGAVLKSGQNAKLLAWVNDAAGWEVLKDTKAETIEEAVERYPPLPPHVHRVLEIRQQLNSASVKKLWAFKNRNVNGRMYGQFIYHKAHTGRWAGAGSQPHNFPRGEAIPPGGGKWKLCHTEQFIADLACRDYLQLRDKYGDVLKALSSALRGFIYGEALVGSDYTAIEAVVLAVLAGEQWRVDVFNSHGKIYETSASKITGIPLAEYLKYAEDTDEHHPDRNGLGKVAELASGYQGGVGAWIRFGAGRYFTPERCEKHRIEWEHHPKRDRWPTLQEFAIQKQVWAWRAASPKIEAFWGGLQEAALAAVRNPGKRYDCRAISFEVDDGGSLICTLPSGRRLTYRDAHVGKGKYGPVVCFKTWINNAWRVESTYGGKLTENIVQAVARDLLAYGMLRVAEAGYKIIMHVHDEIICEGPGTVEELERLMGLMPPWAEGWPVRAAGGWAGRRFRK